MPRYTHLDSDAHRLPSNMTRIAYDADTQVYTYRDESDGSLWESAPGVTFGRMVPVKPPSPLPSVEITADVQGVEPEYTLEEGPDPFGDANAVRPEEGGKGEKGGMRKRVDSVMERIASVREKGSGGRRSSQRHTADYYDDDDDDDDDNHDYDYNDDDEKSLERNTSMNKDGYSLSMSEKETFPSRSSTLRTTRTTNHTVSPPYPPRPSSSSQTSPPPSYTPAQPQFQPQPQQNEPSTSTTNLKRASTLSRLSRFLTRKPKESDPDYDVTPGTSGPEWVRNGNGNGNGNGSRVHRSQTVSLPSRPRTGPGAQPAAGDSYWSRGSQPVTGMGMGRETGMVEGRRKRATTFDEILAGIPGQH